MIRCTLLIMFTAFIPSLYAQGDFNVVFREDGRAIAVPKLKKYDLNIPGYSYGSFINPDKNIYPDLNAADLNRPTASADLPANVQVLSDAYRPFFNPFTPMLMKTSPFALDFTEASILPVNENMALISVGRKSTWPLLGGQTTLTSNLVWHHERWTVSGGGFVGTVYTPLNPWPSLTGGLNLDLHYEVNDRFALRGWGDYSVYGNERRNPYILSNPALKYTGFGGAAEIMLNESFGLGGGVEYRFNHLKGKLEPFPVIYPVFKVGNVRIGVDMK